jgi:hypothetical protein
MNVHSLIKSLSAAAIVAVVMTTGASADTLTETWTGKVGTGVDTRGLFGSANTSLAGDSFTATFVFDTTLGTNLGGTDVFGGLGSGGLTDPLISAKLTIAGATFSIPVTSGTQSEFVANEIRIAASASGFPGDPSIDFGFNDASPLINADLTANFAFDAAQFGIKDGRFNPDPNDQTGLLTLDPASVSLSVAAVPEPSTWAMMILGFLALGWLAYRKQQTAFNAA